MNKLIINRGSKELDKRETYEASEIDRVTLERPLKRDNQKGLISGYNLSPFLKLEKVSDTIYRVIA